MFISGNMAYRKKMNKTDRQTATRWL